VGRVDDEQLTWPVGEVARLSGVTARTLRHYDHIGLLVPAATDPGGRRRYGPAELHRLQRILLLRELGLGLAAIGRALADDGPSASLAALRRHHVWLSRERDRYTRLVETVRTTVETLERGGAMTPENLFAGFEHDPHEAEARSTWGDEAVDASVGRRRGWSADDAERARTGFDRVHRGLAQLRAGGAAPDDPRVQALIGEHHAVVSLFWTPGAAAYRGLGDLYVQDERFRAGIGQGDDALVEFLRDAMVVHAATLPA